MLRVVALLLAANMQLAESPASPRSDGYIIPAASHPHLGIVAPVSSEITIPAKRRVRSITVGKSVAGDTLVDLHYEPTLRQRITKRVAATGRAVKNGISKLGQKIYGINNRLKPVVEVLQTVSAVTGTAFFIDGLVRRGR